MIEENTPNSNKKILKVFPSFVLGKCSCGCGNDIPISPYKGFLRRYLHGHNNTGQKNNNWNGGVRITCSGYKHVHAPKDHPYQTQDGYIMEHRLIYEEYLTKLNGIKTYLHPSMEVHHKNRNKKDNRIENLQLLGKAEHASLHAQEFDYSGRICSNCKSDKTSLAKNKGNKPIWLKIDEKMLCRNCYRKERWKRYGRN